MPFRGQTNSDLVVTVHNGERQCFIKENDDSQSFARTKKYSKKDIGSESIRNSHCDSSVQVTDGRYASTYQITHCHVSPTSPCEEVTEFPLQRKLLYSGDSHFKISGDCGTYHRSCGALRKYSLSPERGNMSGLKHPDDFLISLRKYSKLSANRTLEMVEKLKTEKHVKNPATKDASSPVRKTKQEEPLAFNKRPLCDHSIRQGKSQTCEISKRLRQDRAKIGTKLPFATTTIDVRDLQSFRRKGKEGLCSLTLPNIAVYVGPSFSIQNEILTNTESPQLYNNNMQTLQDVQSIKRDTKRTEIHTTKYNDEVKNDDVTIFKRGLEVTKPQYLSKSIGTSANQNVTSNRNEIKVLNVDTDVTNYHNFFSKSFDVKFDSNDEFLKDAIQRWLHKILIVPGRCTEPSELNFIFKYLYKRLKILKKHNYLIFNVKGQYKLNTKTPWISNNDFSNANVSDVSDNNMTMVINRLTDVLMEKLRTTYKKETAVYCNLVQRNLKIKEILPKLEDDLKIESVIFKDVNFQKGLSKEDQPQYTAANVTKELDNNKTSNSYNNIQKAIEDWLNLLDLPEHFQNYKNIAILALASEIKKRIDRQNYIQSHSPTHVVSDEIELEYFRYLIFKWNNKYLHKRKIETFENVKTLFYRIQKLNPKSSLKAVCFDRIDPVYTGNVFAYPVLMQDKFYSGKENMKCKDTYLNKYTTTPITLGTKPNQKVQCLQLLSNFDNLTFRHDPYVEFEQFVKFWCQEITTDIFTPQEANVAEKAALGIYNGIWKAIINLNYKDSIYHDRFSYEDYLEKEIDELIDCLPQTPQLRSKRHVLKVRLIEKTIITRKYICKDGVMCLKNKLISKILDYLEPLKLNDLYNLKNIKPCLTGIAEMFILWTKYSNENQGKAKAYGKKLFKVIEKLYNILKQKYKSEFDTLNIETFYKNVINELRQINISEDVLLDETDKVLLGLEIDQWFIDLSLISKDVFEDENHKRIIKYILIALVKDNNINVSDDDKKSKLHADIRLILEKNLIKEKNLNIHFLASELLNRIDNMRQLYPKDVHYPDVSNVNSLSFAEKITKYKLGLHDNKNIDLDIRDCQDIIKADDTLRQIPDDTIENSILHTCNAYNGTSVSQKNNVKWHTINENMIYSDNSQNSMKTALDSEVLHSNSDSKVDHEMQEQEKNSKKCCCKISTTSLTNRLYFHDEENTVSINHIDDGPKIFPKILKSCSECDFDTYKDGENSNRNSVRECQTDAELNINKDSEKMAACNKKENSRDMGINVLLNNRSLCNCTVGSSDQEPSSSDASGSKGRCHCTHRFRYYKNIIHSQTENGEHPPFIPVLYPYPYFI